MRYMGPPDNNIPMSFNYREDGRAYDPNNLNSTVYLCEGSMDNGETYHLMALACVKGGPTVSRRLTPMTTTCRAQEGLDEAVYELIERLAGVIEEAAALQGGRDEQP